MNLHEGYINEESAQVLPARSQANITPVMNHCGWIYGFRVAHVANAAFVILPLTHPLASVFLNVSVVYHDIQIPLGCSVTTHCSSKQRVRK